MYYNALNRPIEGFFLPLAPGWPNSDDFDVKELKNPIIRFDVNQYLIGLIDYFQVRPAPFDPFLHITNSFKLIELIKSNATRTPFSISSTFS